MARLAGRSSSPATGPLHNPYPVTAGVRGRQRGGEQRGANESWSFAGMLLPLLHFSVILSLPAQSPTCLLEYIH